MSKHQALKTPPVALQHYTAYNPNIIRTPLCNFTLSNVDVSAGVEFTAAAAAAAQPVVTWQFTKPFHQN